MKSYQEEHPDKKFLIEGNQNELWKGYQQQLLSINDEKGILNFLGSFQQPL